MVIRDQRLLVIRRSQRVRRPGSFCFPGGGIEPGEDEAAAVCRELAEELALRVTTTRRLWQSVTTWQVELSWWAAELSEDQAPVANAAEVASFHWLTLAEIRELPELLPSNHEFLDAWERGEFELEGIPRPADQ